VGPFGFLMPKGLKRYYGQGHLHFVTFSCYRRLPLLHAAGSKNCFVKILAEVRARYRFSLFGYVVMPDHVHLLTSEPQRGTPSAVLKALKQSVSRKLRAGRKRKRAASAQMKLPLAGAGELPQFWQRRFYDFNVWTGKKVREKLDYMHRNPVARKLVKHPKDWPWSSWAAYYQDGACLLKMDPLN